MKTILKSVLTLTLAAGLGIAANAQVAATSPASATILSALTIAHDGTAINFGTISNTTGADVVLDANGVTNVNTGNTRSVARFDVIGSAGAAISVNYNPSVDLILTGVTGIPLATQKIVMTPEVVGTSAAPTTGNQALASTILQGGDVVIGTAEVGEATKFYIWVGGSLATAGTNYLAGVFSGTFNIDVEYN